jgi:isopentenyl-diphosphate delta-isomerase
LEVPVVVKEVGWGISGRVAQQLADAGVAAIDVAGSGGISWSQVEMHRAVTAHQQAVAKGFRDWGIPTVESLLMVRRSVPELSVIASGGIRNGIQIAKAVALGATACGLAGPFLPAAVESTDAVTELIDILVDQLRIAMFAVGATEIAALRNSPIRRVNWGVAGRQFGRETDVA